MEKIKLRAVLKDDSIVDYAWQLDNGHLHVCLDPEMIVVKAIIQFTGLLDKNGKEIFEGDILRHNNSLYYVKFSSNQFVLLLKQVGSKTNWRSLEWCNNVKKYIEIIGNIYENPELLKE